MTTKTTPNRLVLDFGQEAAWTVENSAAIASFLEPDITPLEDLVAELKAALAQPIDFPSMDQAVVAGDSLVFAVDSSVPALPQVMTGVLGFYHDRGTPLGNMSIVLAGDIPNQAANVAAAIRSRLGGDVQIEVHNPDDFDSISYVAADDDAEAVYINRRVVDADVVVPVTCGRPPGGFDDLGSFSLFPLLSNRATFEKFYSLERLDNPELLSELAALADQAAWWTGFMTAVHVIPANEDQVGAVLAGATAAVHEACQERMAVAWGTPELESDLTVALLAGVETQKNWLGFARALRAGMLGTREGGTLVLCTNADLSIGASLQDSAEVDLAATESGLKPATASSSVDASLVSLIERATRDRHVYLVSKIPNDVVESLGMAVIVDPVELSRLIERSAACVILGAAQFRSIGSLEN